MKKTGNLEGADRALPTLEINTVGRGDRGWLAIGAGRLGDNNAPPSRDFYQPITNDDAFPRPANSCGVRRHSRAVFLSGITCCLFGLDVSDDDDTICLEYTESYSASKPGEEWVQCITLIY
ncbi:hypothetical protein HW555_004249 [Spodoptera exigua]|uniref:Uncharacterized protein n=1 Tax=Spodoptera exigua TaxID=7107 RepID=A0A835LCG6_SPOEX|nr:hypothetical protein HW555_004249 [Spodoptera exigua]